MATNRYSKMVVDGNIKRLPLAQLEKRDSDYFEVYRRNRSSLDNISYKYYDDPNYVWLIMLANQDYGSLEYNIPDGAILRIPFPLETALMDYDAKVDRMMALYGFK